jgi:hypothetical protein
MIRLWLAILSLVLQPLVPLAQQPMGGITGGSGGGSKTWTLVQHPINATTCDSNPCSVTVSSTGSGNLGILWFATSSTVTISSISGGGTWTIPTPGSGTCSNTTVFATLCAYNLSLSSGATSISVTLSGVAFRTVIEYLEYSWTGGGSATLDTQSSTNTSGFNTSWPGQTLSLAGAHELISQAIATRDNGCTSITSPYTNPDDFSATSSGSNWLAVAGSINTASGTAPTWTCNDTEMNATGAIAFK